MRATQQMLYVVPRHGPIKLQENRLCLVEGNSNALLCASGKDVTYQVQLPQYPRYGSLAANRFVRISDADGFQIFCACVYKRSDENPHCEPFESFKPFEWRDKKGHPFLISDGQPIFVQCELSPAHTCKGARPSRQSKF